jgi:hypothetical protein
MPACLNCGGRLCKGDIKCFTCDTPAERKASSRDTNLGYARVVLMILFFVCLALTIASIFTDVGPSFTKCAAATVILHFVRTSAVQMSEKKT